MQCEISKDGVQGKQLMLQTAKMIFASGGVRAYYRGLWWGLIGQFPYSSLDLTTFEYMTRWYKSRQESRGNYENDSKPGAIVTAAIGAFSGAFGASVVWPLNLLRTQIQTQGTVVIPQTYTGSADVMQKTIQRDGWKGLFRGITPNLIKRVPSVSITYVIYGLCKWLLGLK